LLEAIAVKRFLKGTALEAAEKVGFMGRFEEAHL
jgi:hypothetical protein